jgi:hypothetical protein
MSATVYAGFYAKLATLGEILSPTITGEWIAVFAAVSP